jgi:hypothetical protein
VVRAFNREKRVIFRTMTKALQRAIEKLKQSPDQNCLWTPNPLLQLSLRSVIASAITLALADAWQHN